VGDSGKNVPVFGNKFLIRFTEGSFVNCGGGAEILAPRWPKRFLGEGSDLVCRDEISSSYWRSGCQRRRWWQSL